MLAIRLRRRKLAGSCADTESPFAQQGSKQAPGLINKIMGVGIGRHTAAGPIHVSAAAAATTPRRQQPAAEQSSLPGKVPLSGSQTNSRGPSKTTVVGPNLLDEQRLDSITDSYDSTIDGGGSGFGGTAAAVTAAAAAGVGAGAAAAGEAATVSRSSSRGDMAVGFTEDELQDRLRELKFVITDKLLSVVATSTLDNGEQIYTCAGWECYYWNCVYDNCVVHAAQHSVEQRARRGGTAQDTSAGRVGGVCPCKPPYAHA